ncbi:MAG TPA: molybdopterin-dependent oxidoreductase [Streptosporangiaceae bacterium]|nr:molybdopterin-dependent oxidoreductase [Streptosporangiaceae bacterium]
MDIARVGRGMIAGLLAAAVALGIGQLVAGFVAPDASPVVAVGESSIGLTPPPVKAFAISAFGSHDKVVLVSGILAVLAILAAVIGVLAMRRLAYGMAGLAVFTAVGLAAALTRPTASGSWVLPTLIGGAAAAGALRLLVRAAPPAVPRPKPVAAPDDGEYAGPPAVPDTAEPGRPAAARPGGAPGYRPPRPAPASGPERRRFLRVGAAAAGTAVVAGLGGRLLSERSSVSRAQSSLRLPKPAHPASPLPAGSNLRIPGLSSFITPNSSFYRVDTAIVLPEVPPSGWHLRIHGMVAREITVSFDQLIRRPLSADYITLTCVSNPVGGPYVGNAEWIGASLASLLREAGIRSGAEQLLSTSVDGFTSGTPVQTVMDGRDAMLAVAMNGTALPVEHGFPVRMVVPGLYGYVSACKWITDINVTTWADRAYWSEPGQGWAQQAPIKTESRIDVPSGSSVLKPGRTPVAGVAWAQHKGVAAVEVRVDSGPWHEAKLATVPDIDCWRQWVYEWDATPGTHLITARATDATGYTQTSAQEPPPPNGASGYPSISVTVSG